MVALRNELDRRQFYNYGQQAKAEGVIANSENH
jgi:hypothetical protein